MDNTNVEEESSDAAAYGLVALCDQSYDGVNTQFTEEIVETSGQLVAAEIVGEDSVKIFITDISSTSNLEEQQGRFQGDDENVTRVDDPQPEDEHSYQYDTSVIAVAQEFADETAETAQEIHRQPQHQTTSDSTEKDNEDVSAYMLTSLQEVDIETIQNQQMDDNENEENSVQLQEQEINDEQAKIIISYAGGILDENYFQALKSRQALMREAVEWKVYARMLLEKGCSMGSNFYEPEVLTVLKATDDVALKAEILSRITEKDMLQPSVQFWDFEKVYEAYGNGRPLNCPSCSMPLIFVPFGQRFALRMLYDVDRPVLLVTSFLRCTSKGKKQHEILGYDPRLLRMFPNFDLPFMLFHKAGITKQMMTFIMENIIGGMTVNRLFDVVKTKYEVNHTITSQFFANEIESIRAHVLAEGGQIEISKDSMFPPYVSCHPSKALLGRCFLASFKEKDDYYKFCMQQLLANECIILDESLCVGARIGIPGVWGHSMKMFPEEYQGMFLVFNEAKHILSWTFLKEGKFSEVQSVLTELRERHHKVSKSLKACFTTKCCAWRDDLRKIFGKWFIVKGNLRLFLDRIIKEMPPDHTYYRDCVNELTLVFREPNDASDVRKDYTADPLVIAHNLQEFIKRWRDVIDERIQAVITEKAMDLLTDLEQHIQAGCLSGIPPEVGDENFNDIHNALRKSVSHCRITVPLVSALFSMCLHDINKTKGAPVDFQYNPSRQTSEEPILSLKQDSETMDEPDAVNTVSIQTEGSEDNQFQFLSPLLVEKQKIISASTIIQAVDKHYQTTATKIPSLVLQAIMYYKYQEDFDAFAPQAIQNLRLLPYYSSALNLISHAAFPKEEKIFDMKSITQGLSDLERRIRRMHVDVTSTARLSGTISDIFSILARQLMKDKICDNLSVEALEYTKQLMSAGIHLLDAKEKDIIALLKNVTGFHDDDGVETTKKELVADVSKTLIIMKHQDKNETKEVTSESNITGTDLSQNDTAVMEVDLPKNDTEEENSENVLIFRDEISEDKKVTVKDDMTGGVMTTDVSEKTGDVDDSNTIISNGNFTTQIEEEKNIGNVQNITLKPDTDTPNDDVVAVAMETDSGQVEVTATSEEFEILKTIADKFGAVITVFTNLEHCWVIPIFPEVFNMFSPHLFVVYRYQRFFPAWLGNRASVSSIRNINLKRQGKEPQCRCGRGTPGKDGQGKCVSKENGKYLTRCICFRLDRGCSHLCDCRNCENPFGSRPERMRPRKPKIPYRQRYAHEAAKIATCKSSSASTTIATQTPNAPEICDVDSGMESWVALEHCVFEALINEIKSEDNVITPSEVQETFNAVINELLNIPELNSIAYVKSIEQITLKLQQRERDVSEYLKIYQQQVDLSLG